MPDEGAPGLMCTSKPEGGIAALLEPASPTPPLPFLSLSLSPSSLARPSSVITAVLRRHASRFDHRTGAGGREGCRGGGGGREGGMQGEGAHTVQQDVQADAEGPDMHSTAGGTAGQCSRWCACTETRTQPESDGRSAEGRMRAAP